MTIDQAKFILKEFIQEDGDLFSGSKYISWSHELDSNEVTLDDSFTIEELEAIVVYIRDKQNAK